MSFVIFLAALLCIAVTVAVAALLSRNRNVLPPRRSTRALDRARPVTTSAGTNNANAAGFGFGALVCRRFVSGVCRAWRIACKQLASSNQNRSSTVLVQAKEDKEDGVPSPCNQVLPLSVNYHFTRQCNYSCGFCFHTAKTSFVLPIEEAKRGLQMLKNAGMKKINFSGGEPFLTKRGYYVGELVRWCKEELELDSVSIVSNGSLITEKWFREFGEHLDILAVSCDSFNEETNRKIGRFQRSRNHLDSLYRVRDWCQQYEVAFKINSVVNTWNWNEDMREEILRLNPVRWKVFQCLLIGGENAGPGALRNAEQFVITDEQFRSFLERHKEVSQLVPESNEKMRDSYLILDEYMRFLDCTRGSKDPSRSVLDVGVEEAIKFSGFDEAMFFRRGGRYMWSKADMDLSW